MPDRRTFLARTAGTLGALALAPSALTALPALAQGPGCPILDMHLHARRTEREPPPS